MKNNNYKIYCCIDPPHSALWVLELQESTITPTASYFLWLASLSSQSFRARTLVAKCHFFPPA